ncbi:nuclease A inhibitor family protein [Adhaeribacter radiodurans]|uniref:Sugar-non-specific nuclease inhibitor NuiA-like protein n=1 Tax=Adhaeribacter radiodurans TaxID=2745197 RepID=A0A7L7L9Z8_9BACT|nr:nuclease A inhibitor family protein [Adhaeribacter radiodurans]QMU29661.1 hypothetical protein HUW48_17210 [Adhaeribacter radiodurans]
MTDIIQTLKAAISGLAAQPDEAPPFEVFYHVNPTAPENNLKITELLTWTGNNPQALVEQQELSDFIIKLSILAPFKNNLPLLTKLKSILQQTLDNIQVYTIHQVNAETYLIGQDEEGNFAGLKTTLATT